jgi:hypothetical protein
MSYVPLAKDSFPNLRWYWYPKGNPFRNRYRVIWPKHPLRILSL